MLSFSFVLAAVTSFAALPNAYGLKNGVGKLPALGYNTWNYYQCEINEDVVLSTAKQMVALGLKDAGYNYVNIDDCYSSKNRTEHGDIIEDPVNFKSGMRNLTDQLHDLGFKTGIYSSAGLETCAGYPASYGNEDRDAELFFGKWNFDYLKYDNCHIPPDEVLQTGAIGRFSRMRDAIARASSKHDKEIFYSLCQWGWHQVWLWGATVGHSWRTTWDIEAHWSSVTAILNMNSFLAPTTDFYGHNDLDMLEIGNGNLNYEESKSHFTAWALMRSPLFIGTDLSKLSAENLEILTNKEILAINQDDVVGTGISPFLWGYNPDWTNDPLHPAQYWSGLTKDGVVFMLLNVRDEPSKMSFRISDSAWAKAGIVYSVRDLWTHTDNGTAYGIYTVENIPAHGVVALLLKEIGPVTGDIPTGQDGAQQPMQV